ncbi:MAG: MFS transporter, partial [Thermoproteus sp.]|nr:MFS transporter [Thermoproteus sp.]
MEAGEYDVRYAWRIAPVLASVALMVMYTEGMLVPSLPAIQGEFGITAAEASWILSIYTISGTVAAAVFGKLGDIYGKKKVLTAIIFVYAAAVTFTGYAPTFHVLLLARAIQGIGMAMFPLAFALIREEFPPRLVPVAQGLVSAMFGIGIIISLPLGAWISQNYGWRVTYHTATPIALLVAFLILLLVRESKYRSAAASVDWLGVLFFAAFSVTLIVAMTEAPTWGWTDERILSLFALSLASLTSLALHEATAADPFIPRQILNRNVIAANVVLFMVAYAMNMSMQTLVYIFEMPPPSGYGLTILQAGIYSTPPALAQMVLAPLAGRAMVKTGVKPVAYAGLAVALIGNVLIAYNATKGLLALVASTVVAFAGLAVLNTSLINLITFSVARDKLGLATGLNTVVRNL